MYSHGGNIYNLMEEGNFKLHEIMDFSASINPLGVPKSVIKKIRDHITHICHYPDPDSRELTQAISRHLGIDPQYILCGNGSTELIYLLVRALKPEEVFIPIPTFSEYEKACMSCGSKVESYYLNAEDQFDIRADEFIDLIKRSISHARRSSHAMAFLCNPNNPTGRLIKRKDMLKISEAMRELGCYLVIDEAFIDFVPEESMAKEVQNNPYLIVLRSMTKFYALAGIRLGFGIFPVDVLKVIKKYKEPWTVNTIAQIAGVTAMDDRGFKEQTYRLIEKEKRFLEEGLRSLSITYIASSVNFYLVRHQNASRIISKLRDKGIMVRDCSNFRGLDRTYMRIAVRSNMENSRLLEEIQYICQG